MNLRQIYAKKAGVFFDKHPKVTYSEFLEAHIERIQALVNQQAENEALWFQAEHITESYLQSELRKLHRVIEEGK